MFHNDCGFEIRCRHDDGMGKPDVSAYLRSLRTGRYASVRFFKSQIVLDGRVEMPSNTTSYHSYRGLQVIQATVESTELTCYCHVLESKTKG